MKLNKQILQGLKEAQAVTTKEAIIKILNKQDFKSESKHFVYTYKFWNLYVYIDFKNDDNTIINQLEIKLNQDDFGEGDDGDKQFFVRHNISLEKFDLEKFEKFLENAKENLKAVVLAVNKLFRETNSSTFCR